MAQNIMLQRVGAKTDLINVGGHWKGVEVFTILHAIMNLMDHCYELVRAFGLGHDSPKVLMGDGTE